MILQVAAELDGQGALRWRFVYATGKHLPDAAIDAAGVVYRLVTDQVGSLRLVVRASDGAVMQRMRHDAWGRVEEDFVAVGFVRVPFGFAGGLVDQVTGLVHFGAREYDPAVGRWVEKDPIRWGGGTTGLYEYCSQDGVNFVDPAGKNAIALGAGGIAIGPALVPALVATSLVAIGIYAWEEWQSWSKGGKQKISDTELAPLSPEEIGRRLEEAKRTGDKAMKKRLEKQQKSNRDRNAQKRKDRALTCDPEQPDEEDDLVGVSE
jgi:RHS repeat-associated protein